MTYAGSGWESGEKTTIRNSAEDVANSLARDWNNFISENYELLSLTGDSLDDLLVTPLQIWNAVFGGPVNFTKFKEKREYGAFTRSHNQIDLYSTSDTYIVNNPRLIVHELGHAFDNALCVANPTCDPDTDSPGSNPGRLSVPSILITNWGDTVNGYHGYAGGWENWQYRNFDKSTAYENFADMFIGWTYNRWWSYWETGHSLATERQDYMNSSMIQWLPLFFGNN